MLLPKHLPYVLLENSLSMMITEFRDNMSLKCFIPDFTIRFTFVSTLLPDKIR